MLFSRNSFHAFYTIGRTDGVLALQNGLVPALWYQMFMNGVRLGSYQMFINLGFTKDKNGNSSWPRSVMAGAVAGCLGAAVASPLYMVRNRFVSCFSCLLNLHHLIFLIHECL